MRRREFWVLVGPSLIVMLGLLVVPLYRTIEWSLQDVNYGSPGTFVGLSNYTKAIGDSRFRETIVFTTGLTVTATVVIVVLGYVLATMINRLHRTRPLVLGAMLVPYVIPHVVGATAYSWLFDSNFGGPVNLLISKVIGHDVLWFTGQWPNRILVMSNIVWAMLPFAMLMILAGLQSVPEELSEAALLDGTSALQRHWHVIIPSIRSVLGFVGLILTMDVFRVFDNLIPLAPSAVDNGNESVMLYIYNIAFRDGSPQLGLGSAVSVLTILVILVLLYPSIRGILKEASGNG